MDNEQPISKADARAFIVERLRQLAADIERGTIPLKRFEWEDDTTDIANGKRMIRIVVQSDANDLFSLASADDPEWPETID